MKTNVIFCCNRNCCKKEMESLIDKHQGKDIKVNKTNNTIFINKDIHIFIDNINICPEKIMGLELSGYSKCVEYTISHDVEQILRTRIK